MIVFLEVIKVYEINVGCKKNNIIGWFNNGMWLNCYIILRFWNYMYCFYCNI